MIFHHLYLDLSLLKFVLEILLVTPGNEFVTELILVYPDIQLILKLWLLVYSN